MIRNIWSILCRDILIDQETNAVSYLQCIEEVGAGVLPMVITQVSIGTLWEKNTDRDEPFLSRVVFVLPSGNMKTLLQTRPLMFNRPRQRLHFKLEGLPITEFGHHDVRVEIHSNGNWQTVACLPLVVKNMAGK
jgi:hypothetical protein